MLSVLTAHLWRSCITNLSRRAEALSCMFFKTGIHMGGIFRFNSLIIICCCLAHALYTVNLKHNWFTKGGKREYCFYKLDENVTCGTIILISFLCLVTKKTMAGGHRKCAWVVHTWVSSCLQWLGAVDVGWYTLFKLESFLMAFVLKWCLAYILVEVLVWSSVVQHVRIQNNKGQVLHFQLFLTLKGICPRVWNLQGSPPSFFCHEHLVKMYSKSALCAELLTLLDYSSC